MFNPRWIKHVLLLLTDLALLLTDLALVSDLYFAKKAPKSVNRTVRALLSQLFCFF